MRRLPAPDAPSVLPGLKPNHPKARMKQPRSTIVMSWPGIAFGEPFRLYFPIRGPMIIPTASPVSPPTACTTPDPAKSKYPWASVTLERRRAARVEGDGNQPGGDHPEAVHHEVHHHGVVGVLRPAEAGLDQGEAGLHEHDQEARDEGPDEVDRDPVLTDLVDDVGDREP